MRRLVTGVMTLALALSAVPANAVTTPAPASPMSTYLSEFISGQPAGELVPMMVATSARPWFILNSNATPRQIGRLPFWTVNLSADVASAAVAKFSDGRLLANRLSPLPKPMAVEDSFVASDPAKITGADLIQQSGNSGAGVSVAVIDTGIQSDHPIFTDGTPTGSRVLSQQACFVTSPGTAEFPCLNGQASDTSAGAADISSDAFLAENGYEHGTHVAGIVAGRKPTTPAWVVSGIAPDASIVPVRVFGHAEGAYDSDILAGLSWVQTNAVALNIAAVNLSLGGAPTPDNVCLTQNAAYETAFAGLIGVGVAPVVAAGNDSNQTTIAPPACVPSAISVGSTNANDSVSIFSNVSATTDLMAPGNLVGSSVPLSKWAQMSGTSMATPVVAGAFALARKADPLKSVATWLATFKATGTPVSATVVTNLPRISISNGLSAYASLSAPSAVAATWADFMNYTITWSTPVLGPIPTGYRITDGATITDVAADVRSFSGSFTAINHVVTIESLNGLDVSPAASVTVAPQSVSVQAVTQSTPQSPVIEFADFCSSPTTPVLKLRYNSPQIATRTLWALTGDGRAQSLAETAFSPATSPLTAGYAKEISISNPQTWLTSGGRIYFANTFGVVGNSISTSSAYNNVVANPLVPAVVQNLAATGSYERATITWDAGATSTWRVLVDGVFRTNTVTNSATLSLTAGQHTVSVCGTAITTNGSYTTGTYYSRRADVDVSVSPKLTQFLTVDAPTEISLASPTAQITASASSLLPVAFASATPLICSVSSTGLVTALAGGACNINVGQSGNADFAAAQTVIVAINVAKSDQVISATNPGLVTVDGSTQIVASSTSGLNLVFSTTTPEFCSVSPSGLVTGVAIGTCVVDVAQPGNGSYNAGITQTLNIVIKLGQSISATQIADLVLGAADGLISASATSGLELTYTSLTPRVCTVSIYGDVTALERGECQIEMNQFGDESYAAAAPLVMTLRVRETQTLTVAPVADVLMTSPHAQLAATISSGLALTYTSLTPSVCSVTAAGYVAMSGAGECRVTVAQAGNPDYVPISSTVTINVSRAAQTITAPSSLALVVGGTSVTVGAMSSSSLALTYTSITTGICTVSSSGLVSPVALGDCEVRIDQAGTIVYAPASRVTIVIPVRNAQVITASQIPGIVFGASLTVSASASSGLALNYGSNTPLICSIDAIGKVTSVNVGTCDLVISQAGNATWAATQKIMSFNIVAPRPTVVTKVAILVTAVTSTTAKARYTWLKPLNSAYSKPTAYVIKWRSISASGVASIWKSATVTKLQWYSPTYRRGTTLIVQIAAKGTAGVGPVVKTTRKL
ncbi:MAG: hypothetical protein RL441_821 [Actinomycetota bacterium]